jgi:hypothetical protein
MACEEHDMTLQRGGSPLPSVPSGLQPLCQRKGCTELSLFRPVFRFVFTNGACASRVRPDVSLCAAHWADLERRFRAPDWQAQFQQSLPPGSADVDWQESRLLADAASAATSAIAS